MEVVFLQEPSDDDPRLTAGGFAPLPEWTRYLPDSSLSGRKLAAAVRACWASVGEENERRTAIRKKLEEAEAEAARKAEAERIAREEEEKRLREEAEKEEREREARRKEKGKMKAVPEGSEDQEGSEVQVVAGPSTAEPSEPGKRGRKPKAKLGEPTNKEKFDLHEVSHISCRFTDADGSAGTLQQVSRGWPPVLGGT